MNDFQVRRRKRSYLLGPEDSFLFCPNWIFFNLLEIRGEYFLYSSQVALQAAAVKCGTRRGETDKFPYNNREIIRLEEKRFTQLNNNLLRVRERLHADYTACVKNLQPYRDIFISGPGFC